MGYTFWIAVIGCVTGLISLAVEVARYLAERPHIQVRTYDELNNLIYIQEDVVKKLYSPSDFKHGYSPYFASRCVFEASRCKEEHFRQSDSFQAGV